MKYIPLILSIFLFSATMGFSQGDKAKRPSPPKELKTTINNTEIAVNYSSPSAKGRTLWGKLVPYNKVWRTGANEATTIEFSGDTEVAGEAISAGKYSLFTIPAEESWTIILNKVSNQWGAFSYDKSQDVFRVKVIPVQSDSFSEQLVFTSDGSDIVLRWGNLAVPMRIGPAE